MEPKIGTAAQSVADKMGVLCVSRELSLHRAVMHWCAVEPDVQSAGHVLSPLHLVMTVARRRPHITLVTPDVNAAALAALIRATRERVPDARLLVCGRFNDPRDVAELLGAGAAGIVCRETDADAQEREPALLSAARAIHGGATVVIPPPFAHGVTT